MSQSLPRQSRKGQPLPTNPFQPGGDNHTAYELCLQFELIGTTWFVNDLRHTPPFEQVLSSMSPDFAARVLGYSLCYAPNDTGRDTLVRDILACGGDQPWMAVLAYLYVFGLIRVFYTLKGPTAAVTPAFTPRLSTAAQNRHLLTRSSSNASTLRALALLRDAHRCVFTGRVDGDCLDIAASIDPSTTADVTNVAYIIMESLTDNIHGIDHQDKLRWASTVGAMIERFGGFRAHDVLGQDNLHSPKNAFIASVSAHQLFDRLEIWLTPAMNAQQQVIPNTYNVRHAEGILPLLRAYRIDVNRPVVFRDLTVGGQIIPAPDPRIIELHAACAKIAHMSGAADLLRELYRDTDNIADMTQPNAAYELSRALKTLQMDSASA